MGQHDGIVHVGQGDRNSATAMTFLIMSSYCSQSGAKIKFWLPTV